MKKIINKIIKIVKKNIKDIIKKFKIKKLYL